MAVFAVTQGTLFQFWTPESLRGYGCGVPNGALWTIGITVQFYIIAWFLYKILKNRKWYVWLAALGTSILLGQLGNTVVDTLENETIKKLFGQTIVCYLWLFLLGMTVGHFFEQLIPFCRKWWIILIAAGIIIGVADIDLTIGYGLFRTPLILLGFLGFAYNFPKLKLKKDISFGIFIYHMIVANVMITFGWTGKFIYLLIATAVSCLLAYLSTITIGEYCAKKK